MKLVSNLRAFLRRPGSRESSDESRPRFHLLDVEDVLALPDPEWLIDGIIPKKAIAQIYGAPNVGKTFVALDIALSIAAGVPWGGQGETDDE